MFCTIIKIAKIVNMTYKRNHSIIKMKAIVLKTKPRLLKHYYVKTAHGYNYITKKAFKRFVYKNLPKKILKTLKYETVILPDEEDPRAKERIMQKINSFLENADGAQKQAENVVNNVPELKTQNQ
ncbi:MAG: hypothetical protein CBE41_01680 [Gammaproteobacteria bacterium TMED281]|nr:MAG: hypothetical protein CBE41_01680 [Gammaproteobacteria bacterium TMED281]